MGYLAYYYNFILIVFTGTECKISINRYGRHRVGKRVGIPTGRQAGR
jgi:hypothetical protein